MDIRIHVNNLTKCERYGRIGGLFFHGYMHVSDTDVVYSLTTTHEKTYKTSFLNVTHNAADGIFVNCFVPNVDLKHVHSYKIFII